MYTYQDLLDVGESDTAKANFCYSAINEFRFSREYCEAQTGERYYAKHNQTIEEFRKWLYTMTGRKIPDATGANYKLKTLIFRRLIIQQVQYVLGNGITLENPKNKEKLGKDIDYKLQVAAKKAMVAGRSFGFWNYDHLEVFGYADTPSSAGFCPLYDDQTSELKAGVRFWQRKIGDNFTCWYVLYEEDGYTEYVKRGDEQIKMTQPKKAYKIYRVASEAMGLEKEIEENYNGFPIVPLYANDLHDSELVGIQEKIDAYDLIESGLANTIDDTAEIYWVIKNAGGMDDPDVAKFLQRIKDMHGASIEDAESVEAHTVNIPVEARKTLLELIRKEIYEDFGALDVSMLSASSKTATEIKAAYQSQDNKCADFEYMIIEFMQKILKLAGIPDENPTFVWNKVVNQSEQTNMIMSASNYLSDEIIIKHLPFLTPEEAEQVIAQREQEGYSMFNADDEAAESTEEEQDDAESDDELSNSLNELMEEYGNDVVKQLEELMGEL